MKKYLIITLLISSIGFAQTKNAKYNLIKETIMNYINGTSYNNINQIKKAFYPDANLYLDKKDSLWVLSIKDYLGFYKNKEKGKFNGRIGKILSIEYFGNIAQAKAEILMPWANKRYVDLFILKIVNGEWKIISKTANAEKSNKKGEKILFVVSNAHFYGNSTMNTGNSFSEIVYAYHEFSNANYTIDFVSPNGGECL